MPNAQSAITPLPAVILSPIRAGVPAAGGTLEVLVRVQAPAMPVQAGQGSPMARPPLRLALVVDRSGSMAGQPLTEALHCVSHIAARLQPVDQLAVVLYDHQVQTLIPLRPATSAAAVADVLAGIDSGGTTDLFAGWEQGARELEAGHAEALSRVILLSDGQANHGLVDPAEIEKHCARWLADKGVSTTTVGLGRSFNEELMIGMARAGGGQQYYGQTAEDLLDGFDEELALLEALCLRKLRIKLIAGVGVIVEPLGLVRQNPDQTYALSDLAWGAESWMLVRLHIAGMVSNDPTQAETGVSNRALLSVALEAEPLDGTPVAVASPVLSLQGVDAKAWDALPKDDMVSQRLLEVQFGETGAKVRELLVAGDAKAAQKLLQRMEAGAVGHPWLQDKLKNLQALAERDAFMAQKELRYSQVKMSSRLSSDDVLRYAADETDRGDIPAFLRRKSSEGKGRKA